ncbi:MAG: hypothetical protein WBP25_12145, partial [Giesbergeria sp.]
MFILVFQLGKGRWNVKAQCTPGDAFNILGPQRNPSKRDIYHAQSMPHQLHAAVARAPGAALV